MAKSTYDNPKDNDVLVDEQDLNCYIFQKGKWERQGTNLAINPREEKLIRLRFFSINKK